MHLATEDGGTFLDCRHPFLECVVALFDAGKEFVGLALLANEHTYELDPLSLSQRVQLLVAQMRHQQDACLANGVIATALGGRDEDDVRIGSEYQLGIDITFHAYLDDAAVLDALADVLVEQVLRPRDALHHVVAFKEGEVRQLQGRHHNGTLDRYHHFLVAIRDRGISLMYQCETVFAPHVYQTDVGRVADGKSLGIPDGHLDSVTSRGFFSTIVLPLSLLGTTATA